VLGAARCMPHERASLQQELATSAEKPKGRLQLGAVPTAVPVAARFAARLQAMYPGIAPVVRSLSSQDIDEGLENLSLDLALGFADRLTQGGPFVALAQYTEHYFLLRRLSHPATGPGAALQLGAATRDAAQVPLCLLPGVLVGAVRSQGELEALPLVAPDMATPVAFIYLARARASRALEAARHSGSLRPAAS